MRGRVILWMKRSMKVYSNTSWIMEKNLQVTENNVVDEMKSIVERKFPSKMKTMEQLP